LARFGDQVLNSGRLPAPIRQQPIFPLNRLWPWPAIRRDNHPSVALFPAGDRAISTASPSWGPNSLADRGDQLGHARGVFE